MIDNLYSEECERQILSLLLCNPNTHPNILNKLYKEDFYSRTYRIIYNGIKELFNSNKLIDIVSVSEYLKFKNELENIGGRQTINELALEYDSIKDIDYLIKTLIKYSKKRQLYSLLDTAKDELDKNTDVDTLGVDVYNKVQDIINRKSETKFQSLSTGIVQLLDNVGYLMENNQSILGLSTGFISLDKTLNGLNPSRLYLIAARPSVGKSAFVQQIAENVAKDKHVLFFSLEMGVEEYTQRSIYRRSGYNQSHLINNIIPKEKILDAFTQAGAELDDLNLHIVDDSTCSLNIIERNINECIAKNGSCDLVVVDYLQLMNPADKYRKDDKDVATDNSKGLKRLARKYKIPIIALSQLSRNCEMRQDKRPQLSDLRDSGSLEQDADVVMFIYRSDIYEPKYAGTAEIIVAKNRQGERGKIINLAFNKGRVMFSELPERKV